ncbi:flagellin lysine-N-methylase [Stigmatella sp. ncwal1]|uniref:Flagellin lysine-N-methylase n=1 Tax=Stigmatella ashevillensis TaxID=2995309 RepID=A0ABT5D706_9BACT|nr:flagellin lysine-N-methylase [Stigmatella ashevillena]MDC0708633.1 flagellin lysine-N-methylase [Stigmatella ashevillena]
MTLPATTLRFMTRFRCIAERCEDTCCGGLRVGVSEASVQRIHETLRAAGKPEPTEGISIPFPEGAPSERTLLRMRSDGHCVFLDTERRCSLHREHGEAVLPDVCATFPRTLWVQEGRLEVSGSLACPEAVRLLLLAEDAVEQVPVPPGLVARPEAARPAPGLPGDLYVLHAGAVRDALREFLLPGGHPLSSRLSALARWALRMDGLFRGPSPLPEDEEETRALLRAELQGVGAFVALAQAPPEPLGPWEEGGARVLRLLTQLKHLSGVTRSERFARFVQGCRSVLGVTGEEGQEGSNVWRLYTTRRAGLDARHGARLEQYFRHYLENYLLRHPHTEAFGLLAYVHRLTVRLALLRLTLAAHPGVSAECTQETLDQTAVECFQLLSRNVDLAPDFLALPREGAGGDRARCLEETLAWARFS